MRFTLRFALPALVLLSVPLALWARHRQVQTEWRRSWEPRHVVVGVYRDAPRRIELGPERSVPLTGETARRPDLDGRRVLIDATAHYVHLGSISRLASYEVCCIHPLPEETHR